MPSIAAAKELMEKAIEATRREFASVRTGKATPALLEMVRVEAYGSKVPLNQVGTISAPEPRLLVIQPWDKSLIGEIEKGIRTSDLGLNPSNDGNVVRIPIPALTEERRRELVRVLQKLAEEGRISVRHARQEANREIRRQQQENEIGEDEAHRLTDQVQKLTDEYIARIDEMLDIKEQEEIGRASCRERGGIRGADREVEKTEQNRRAKREER